uniref:Uncharacterized protein n=1 Tax=Rhizophora mucronata TaxID=61149 RepID=A0A2P2PAC7_RHIMU
MSMCVHVDTCLQKYTNTLRKAPIIIPAMITAIRRSHPMRQTPTKYFIS